MARSYRLPPARRVPRRGAEANIVAIVVARYNRQSRMATLPASLRNSRMSLDRVPAGADVPNDCNVVIEIPMHGEPIKYEVDKETGAVFVDRFMSTAMHYPCNYGYIPQTLSDDGDPVRRAGASRRCR